MKIAIFTDNFYPELSGITDSATMLGSALARRGHSVIFVVPSYSKKDYAKAKLLFHEGDYGANVTTIRLPSIAYPQSPTGQSRIVLPWGPLGSAMSKLRKIKPDVIHTQSPFGAGIEALMVSKMLKIPLVGTNHTPIAEFMAYSPIHPKWFVEIFLRFYSWYYNRCQFVSAPCEALLDDMSKHGFKRTGSEREAISNPILLDSFLPAKNEAGRIALKKRFGFSPHTVLYAGRLAEEKHISVIIKAIKLVEREIPDVVFAITGHGNAEAALKKLTAEIGLQDKVKFLGYVDFSEFPLVYQASDIFAVMSTAETQCISLMQAFSCGMPAVVARAWGLPEYTDERAGIIIKPGDADALAKNIIGLFKNPARMKEMGAAGNESVKKYSPSFIADKWEHVYSGVIKSAGSQKSK
jgi:glycosyltransferase involved in cell wall biosynthesis